MNNKSRMGDYINFRQYSGSMLSDKGKQDFLFQQTRTGSVRFRKVDCKQTGWSQLEELKIVKNIEKSKSIGYSPL